MFRPFVVFSVFFLFSLYLVACSSDKSLSTASAGKANDLDDLFSIFNQQQTPAEPDSVVAVEEDSTIAVDSFHIQVVFVDPLPEWTKERVREAARAWEKVIIGSLPDSNNYETAVFDNAELTSAHYEHFDIDDFLLLVYDGKNDYNYQSWAYQWGARDDGSNAAHLPLGGHIFIDTGLPNNPAWPDGWNPPASFLRSEGNRVRRIATHEIGHVLGLADAFYGYKEGIIENLEFVGSNLVATWGEPIPINDGGCNCHWYSNKFVDGVMSYYPSADIFQWMVNYRRELFKTVEIYDFITDVEVAALEDLGYTVDYTHARTERLQLSPRLAAGKTSIEIGNSFCAGVIRDGH